MYLILMARLGWLVLNLNLKIQKNKTKRKYLFYIFVFLFLFWLTAHKIVYLKCKFSENNRNWNWNVAVFSFLEGGKQLLSCMNISNICIANACYFIDFTYWVIKIHNLCLQKRNLSFVYSIIVNIFNRKKNYTKSGLY